MARGSDPSDANRTARSAVLFEAARRVIPGGVNSPVRAFRAVGGSPRFIQRGTGALVVDVDGNEYVDYVMSWGALPLGHAHPAVVEAIARQASRGASFGAPTELETELAELITRAMPAVEMLRFVSSGTEAVMSAIRLARAATGRAVVLKFDGCYHGHSDALLVSAGSGLATLGIPSSHGVPAGAVVHTLSVPFNDVEAVTRVFDARGDTIAAVIVEPVAGNMGLVRPLDGFLETLRALTSRHGALLIFDEVMTGARVAAGGAQGLFAIRPDLTCLGKVIGGGLPAAAFGGARELMHLVAPEGGVYQAGTLSGNPLAMAAGIATLRQLATAGAYDRLSASAATLADQFRQAGAARGIPVHTDSVGGLWGFFFSGSAVKNFADAQRSNVEAFRTFFHACLSGGVYLPPSAFESCFTSLAHDDGVVTRSMRVLERALDRVADTLS